MKILRIRVIITPEEPVFGEFHLLFSENWSYHLKQGHFSENLKDSAGKRSLVKSYIMAPEELKEYFLPSMVRVQLLAILPLL